MAVTPMDLQVLFMQESRVAREAERMRRHGGEVRARMAERTAYKSLREVVDETVEVTSKEVDEEGSQGTPNYFARREYNGRETQEDRRTPVKTKEEGKGEQMDFTA